MKFNDQELATVLAALRVFQNLDDTDRAAMDQFSDEDPLTDEKIDALAERLNMDEAATVDALDALDAIATAFDQARNRAGNLQATLESGNALRELALRYKVGGSQDPIEQVVQVAHAILKLYV